MPQALFQLPNEPLRSGVSPHNGVMERLSGFPVPHHGGLSLIRDANRFDGLDAVALVFKTCDSAIDAFFNGLHNLQRIVFVPTTLSSALDFSAATEAGEYLPRLGVYLSKLKLMRCNNVSSLVEY